MRPADSPPSPAFPALDPIIVDDEMESAFRDADMDFLDPANLEMSTGNAGNDFDDLFSRATNSRTNAAAEPSKHYQHQNPLRQQPLLSVDSPAESPENSSLSSSSESPRNHLRHASIASSNSAAHSDNPMASLGFSTDDWMRPELSSVKEEPLVDLDSSYNAMDGGSSLDPDLESSNKAMDAAFDFESAASSPSPLKTENTQQPKGQKRSKSQFWNRMDGSAARTSTETPSASSVSQPKLKRDYVNF